MKVIVPLRLMLTTPTPEVAAEDSFIVYPDPTDGLVTITQAYHVDAGSEVQLLDHLGRCTLRVRTTGTSTILDVSLLAPGIYTLIHADHDGQQRAKGSIIMDR